MQQRHYSKTHPGPHYGKPNDPIYTGGAYTGLREENVVASRHRRPMAAKIVNPPRTAIIP